MIDTIQTAVDSIATVTTIVDAVPAPDDSNFFLDNWIELLIGFMAFIKVIVNLTPTEEDNKVFGWIDILINAVIKDRRKNV